MFPAKLLKRANVPSKAIIRYKNPDHHWSVVRKKTFAVDKALQHFDDFYNQVYSKKWLSIRKALLKDRHKYVAVLNYYGDLEATKSALESLGALNIRKLFALEKGYIEAALAQNKPDRVLDEIFRRESPTPDSPEGTEVKPDAPRTFNASDYSLKTSLDQADLDTKRLIDSDDSLSVEVLHQFVPATRIKGKEDFILESSHYKMYDQKAEFHVDVSKEYDLHFPEHLNVYCFEEGNKSDFPPAKRASTGVLNYYLMDGGSVLPVLALDIKPNNRVLDMCCAPGGKSLLALQTLYPERIVSNDVSLSRVRRMQSVYKQFLIDFEDSWLGKGKVKLTQRDARSIDYDHYDRILVDVPCTTDRISLHENDNNVFKPSRIKERLQLPELQGEILFHALNLVKKGGVVVYSTCTLSPIQNDGVVHMALKRAWEETDMKIIVKDLSPALMQTKSVYKFAEQRMLRYGHLVIPLVDQNFGPTYFCKLQKIQ
ncbi:unnamed protein product [Phyllotreta striolata]|uniref:NOL1/NOP2/Sun domain family member 4 n=1 Tax=Phyllotreta striolata TaxID=444603 RepID=A0A9N9TJR1_PHYSR|nr:unnamed protein product [Phyllotreta striolata]